MRVRGRLGFFSRRSSRPGWASTRGQSTCDKGCGFWLSGKEAKERTSLRRHHSAFRGSRPHASVPPPPVGEGSVTES